MDWPLVAFVLAVFTCGWVAGHVCALSGRSGAQNASHGDDEPFGVLPEASQRERVCYAKGEGGDSLRQYVLRKAQS